MVEYLLLIYIVFLFSISFFLVICLLHLAISIVVVFLLLLLVVVVFFFALLLDTFYLIILGLVVAVVLFVGRVLLVFFFLLVGHVQVELALRVAVGRRSVAVGSFLLLDDFCDCFLLGLLLGGRDTCWLLLEQTLGRHLDWTILLAVLERLALLVNSQRDLLAVVLFRLVAAQVELDSDLALTDRFSCCCVVGGGRL